MALASNRTGGPKEQLQLVVAVENGSTATTMAAITTHLLESDTFPSHSTLSQSLALFCVTALICISVTAPAISFSDSYPYFRIEQSLLPLICLAYIWLLLSGHGRLIRLNGMFLVASLFCCSILFSLSYGSTILHHAIIPRDYYELPKIWLPVAFYTIGYEANLSEHSLRRLLKFFALPILLVCLYAWEQFAKLNLAYKLNPYYSGGVHIDRALEYGGRVYSTMSNPNVLGQLMTWCLVAFTLAVLYKVGNRALNAGMALACIITLVLTGSRFGLITAGFGLAMIVTLPSSLRRRSTQFLLLLLILPIFAVTVQVVSKINAPTLERFQSLWHPLEVDSLRSRTDDQWRDAANDFFKSPVIGHGPLKTVFTGVVTDSEYLDVLKEFGIVGFLAYIPFYLLPLFLMWRGLRSAQRAGPLLEAHIPATFLFLRVGIVMVVTALLMNVALTTFYNQLLQAFLWIWMGLAVRSAKTISDSATVANELAQARAGSRERGEHSIQ